MLILGIDPGSKILGIGLITCINKKTSYVASGCVKIKDSDMGDKLLKIYTEITKLIEQYKPNIMAIEKAFFGVNASSTLVLSQVRGVLLLISAQHKLQTFEYSPKTIKASICASGNADKTQVGYMVKNILSLSAVPQTDAADALAVALCHSNKILHS